MTEIGRIRDQIERAFDGDPWCGPSLMSLLEGVSSDLAWRRVPGLSHSIVEIVLHLSAWQGVVARRINGEAVAMPDGGEWPSVDEPSDLAWQAALQGLRDTHRRLLEALDAVDETLLDSKVGDSRDRSQGTGMTAYANLLGIAQHAMYHAGQISLLTKLTNPTPSGLPSC